MKIKQITILLTCCLIGSVGGQVAYGMLKQASAEYLKSSACVKGFTDLGIARSAIGVTASECFLKGE